MPAKVISVAGDRASPNTSALVSAKLRWALLNLTVTGALGLAIPLLLAYHFGSIHSPSADDWAYDRSAFTLATTGKLNLYHWGTIDILGQLFLAVPVVWLFGSHVAVLNCFTCVLGFFGLLALIVLGRNSGLSRPHSLMLASMCALCPMWAALSTSFMAEVPSLAVAIFALAAASHALRGDRLKVGWLILSFFLAFLAFSIREQMMCVELAIAAGTLVFERSLHRPLRPWLISTVVLIVISLIFFGYRHMLPTGGYEYPIAFQPGQLIAIWIGSWPLVILGLFALPLILYAGPVAIVKWAWTQNRFLVYSLFLAIVIAPPLYHLYTTAGYYQSGTATPTGVVTRIGIVSHTWVTPEIGNWYYDLSGSHLWAALLPNSTVPAPPIPDWAATSLYAIGLLSAFLLALVLTRLVQEAWPHRRLILGRGRMSSSTRTLIMLNSCTALYLLTILTLNLLVSSQNWDEYYLFLLPALYVDVLFCRSHVIARPSQRTCAAWKASARAAALLCIGLLPALGSGLAYTSWFESYLGAVQTFQTAVVSSHDMQLKQPGAANFLADWMLTGLEFGDSPNMQAPYYFRPANAAELCYGVTAYVASYLPSQQVLSSYHALPLHGRWHSWLYNYVLVAIPFVGNSNCNFTFSIHRTNRPGAGVRSIGAVARRISLGVQRSQLYHRHAWRSAQPKPFLWPQLRPDRLTSEPSTDASLAPFAGLVAPPSG